jgi:hypothetical protein
MDNPKLKPCPFCGGEDLDIAGLAVYCGECGTFGPTRVSWNTRTPTNSPAIAALIEACVESVLPTTQQIKAAQDECDGLPCQVEVKPLVIHELRYGYWDAGYGYQIAHNVDDYYRIRCHGKVICKKIKGWSRALEWLQTHHDAIIRGALV